MSQPLRNHADTHSQKWEAMLKSAAFWNRETIDGGKIMQRHIKFDYPALLPPATKKGNIVIQGKTKYYN